MSPCRSPSVKPKVSMVCVKLGTKGSNNGSSAGIIKKPSFFNPAVISIFALAIPSLDPKFSMWASPINVIAAASGSAKRERTSISPA